MLKHVLERVSYAGVNGLPRACHSRRGRRPPPLAEPTPWKARVRARPADLHPSPSPRVPGSRHRGNASHRTGHSAAGTLALAGTQHVEEKGATRTADCSGREKKSSFYSFYTIYSNDLVILMGNRCAKVARPSGVGKKETYTLIALLLCSAEKNNNCENMATARRHGEERPAPSPEVRNECNSVRT